MTTTTVPPRGRLVINGTGDVNLDPTFVRTFPKEGYEIAWSGLDGLFNADDLTVVNLECSPGSGGSPWNKKWTFTCDEAAYESMRAAGVEVTNVANNHSADFGLDAMLTGLELLQASDLTPVGAGATPEAAYRAGVFEVDGWTVAVLGATAVGPENGSWIVRDDRPGLAAATNVEAMAAAIRAADELADIVLVSVHWEEESQTTPPGWVRRLGEAYIDAGADGIFGHHSHRLNPLEWYEGRPIAWGLGNFVWQAYPTEAKRTAVAQFVFEPDGRIGACLVPVIIERTGHPVLQPPYEGPCAPDQHR